MPSAREIRTRLRRNEDTERRKREDAVVAVGDAAAAALKARADNDAALREPFEAALKTRDDDGRVAKLREAFEAALADSPSVFEAELVAGRAVHHAATFKVTQIALAELTEQRVEDLRRWAQMAKQGQPGTAPSAPLPPGARSGEAAAESSARPVTGFAVVSQPSSADDQDPAKVVGDAAATG